MTKLFVALVAASLRLSPAFADEPKDILNVSYDVSRELYVDINKAFVREIQGRYRQRPHHQPVACRLVQAGARRVSTGSRPTW